MAVGDVTGDGVDDIITAPGKGLARATVKVFDGNTGQQVAAFAPFAGTFKGGAYLDLAESTTRGGPSRTRKTR